MNLFVTTKDPEAIRNFPGVQVIWQKNLPETGVFGLVIKLAANTPLSPGLTLNALPVIIHHLDDEEGEVNPVKAASNLFAAYAERGRSEPTIFVIDENRLAVLP